MMLQKKSNAWARLKYAYVLPLAATAVAVFAHPEISKQFEEISSAKITHFALITSDNDVKNLPEADFSLLTSEHSDALTANEPAHSTPLNAPEIEMPEDRVWTNIEIMPEYPEGEAALLKYLSDHLVYPLIAAENGIQGTVSCRFIVEKDGSVTNVEVIKGIDSSLDNESVRVLQKLPKFNPGMHEGQPVRAYFMLPVRFRLKNIDATPPTKTANDQSAETTQKSESFVWNSVEQMPSFPGGNEALFKWINDNLVYPQIAHENGIQGRVSCQFTVQADGSVTNVEIVNGRDPSLDKEAIRVLKKLPNFIPGKQRGEPVAVRLYMSTIFRLTNTDKDSKPIAQAELADANAPKSPFTVYPNPVNDVLTIVIDQPAILAKYAAAGKKVSEPTYEFRLYNVSGVMVLHTTAKINKVQINVSKIPAGNYFLHLSDGIESQPEVKQIIIRH